ncbi:hypothetical protein H311_01046 [Anncaliia algerae PRA109]|nr:hypothetical protein H311_01046 [Anncaliia algerae PRA109]
MRCLASRKFSKLHQIDETTLNFKYNLIEVKPLMTKKRAFIFEYHTKITRCFAKIISNELFSTILPIINDVIIAGAKFLLMGT